MREIARLVACGFLVAGTSLPARAALLDVPSPAPPYNAVTTDGLTFTLVTCTQGVNLGTPVACGSGVGTFVALAGGTPGIVISGQNGNPPLQQANNNGAVETFLQFALTSPIQSMASLSAIITGCGGNTAAAGCAGTSFFDDSGTTVYVTKSTNYSNPADQLVNPSATNLDFENINPAFNQDIGTWAFTPQAPGKTVYITMDLSSTSAGGYTSFDSVVLAVPEPASLALLVCCLAGFAALRRRWRRVMTSRPA